MKFKFVFLCLFFSFISFQAQVGIGTTTPKAKLQIKAGTTPSNTDGVLIPSMDNFPTAQNPGADQDGMLIFITGQGTPHKGFYYWSNSDATWIDIFDKKQNLKIPFVTRTELDAITTPENGQLVYDSTDDVTLMWNGSNWIVLSNDCFPQPTTANAGVDINLYDGSTSTALNANTPVEGQGQWTVFPTGTTASFSDIHDPHATFSGEACTSYTLKWSITTACGVSSDNIYVNIIEQPTTANAGSIQSFTDNTTMATLNANTPTHGIGTWTVFSPSGTTYSFSNIHDPHATFSGDACTNYALKWTIQTCPSSSSYSTVQINFNETPTTANAGATINSPSSQTVTLAANTPTQGTGTWSIVSGGTGTFANPNDPTTTFTADNNNTKYVLKWTIAACSSSSNSINVFIGNVVGQSAYGGVIFYVDATGNHGLVVSTTDQGSHKWACTNTNISTGTTIGIGAANTTNIVTDQSTCTDFAAKVCDNLVLNGYNDWFLPSKNELLQLKTNISTVNNTLNDLSGTSFTYTYYWSSSQNSIYNAFAVHLLSSTTPPQIYGKSLTFQVRALRAF